MRTIALTFALIALLLRPAAASFFTIDRVGASTLLLPYFEVDLDDPNGENTIFRVANLSPFPTIAHVVLWTDWGIPTIGFEIFLSGDASQDIDLSEVFGGQLPDTVPLVLAAARTSGIVDPCGSDMLDPFRIAHIGDAHTGQPSIVFENLCSGSAFEDGKARGFVTIDVVSDCTNLLPGSATYFNEDFGAIIAEDVLYGHYAYVHRESGNSAGGALVAIEAASFSTSNSFYSRFTPSTSQDGRELLPQRWTGQFFNGDVTTDVIVWSDPGETTQPLSCDSVPSWYPLGSTVVRLRDNGGDQFEASAFIPFPAVANRARVGDPNLPSPYSEGAIDIFFDAVPIVVLSGIAAPDRAQGHVGFFHRYSDNQAAFVSGAAVPTPVLGP